MCSTLGIVFFFFFSRQHFEIIFHILHSKQDLTFEMSNPVLATICMKRQILFSRKNKKKINANLSSAELAQRVVKVKERDYYNGLFV